MGEQMHRQPSEAGQLALHGAGFGSKHHPTGLHRRREAAEAPASQVGGERRGEGNRRSRPLIHPETLNKQEQIAAITAMNANRG
jgi:hypothetical protein